MTLPLFSNLIYKSHCLISIVAAIIIIIIIMYAVLLLARWYLDGLDGIKYNMYIAISISSPAIRMSSIVFKAFYLLDFGRNVIPLFSITASIYVKISSIDLYV